MVAYARTVTEYIPGSGCGTFNTIKILKRDPSVQELANGCIYVMKEVTSFQPQGISKIQYMKLSNYIVATYYQSPAFQLKLAFFPLQMLRFSALCGANEQKLGEPVT